tara:strand:- start:295 stop:1200 length:906 start_codon:yes stop_codon:yes gene_type:complete
MTQKKAETNKEFSKKAELLMETLPFMRRYTNKIIVIKFGGNAMGKKEYVKSFAEDVALLQQVGMLPIVVHGGGPQIGEMLKKLKIESNFVDGLRVTDEATIDVVEMVLCGVTNKSIVSSISQAGANAVGISGKDGNLISAKRISVLDKNSDSNVEKAVDLGFVGEPEHINVEILNGLIAQKMIPVIAPVGIGKNGESYNINADTAAGAVASAMKATRMIMLTDVMGVLDSDNNLLSDLSIEQAKKLIDKKIVVGGMIPKLKTCINTVKEGTEAGVIMDGRLPHALLIELFTEHGIGTLIKK